MVFDYKKFLGTQNRLLKDSLFTMTTSISESISQANYLALFSNSSSLNWSGKLNLCNYCSYLRDQFNWILIWCVLDQQTQFKVSGRCMTQLSKEFLSYYSLICYELFLIKGNLFGDNFFNNGLTVPCRLF